MTHKGQLYGYPIQVKISRLNKKLNVSRKTHVKGYKQKYDTFQKRRRRQGRRRQLLWQHKVECETVVTAFLVHA